jgi:pSer/pThr/pTyr-binding forkhead associated (FHA) protein
MQKKAVSLETVPVAALDMQRNMLSDIPTVLQPTVSGDLSNDLPPDEPEKEDLPTHEARTKAYILVEVNGRTTVKHWLNRPILTIGRFSTADIQIASPRVSRFHAMIHWKNGKWILEDTDSLNGLTYQGERVDQLALTDGDYIYLDPTITILYEEESVNAITAPRERVIVSGDPHKKPNDEHDQAVPAGGKESASRED